jgi:hypothetical protein
MMGGGGERRLRRGPHDVQIRPGADPGPQLPFYAIRCWTPRLGAAVAAAAVLACAPPPPSVPVRPSPSAAAARVGPPAPPVTQPSPGEPALGGDVFAPRPGVLCDRAPATDACFDRYGLSLAFTGNHLGLGAADRLEEKLSGTMDRRSFTLSDGVTCFTEQSICTLPDPTHPAAKPSPKAPVAAAHTRALFTP